MYDERRIKGIVFSDLDETLLDDMKGEIPKSALLARSKLKEKGYILVLATGRDMDTHYSVRFAEILQPDAVINNNGAKITAEGKLIFKHYMDENLVRSVFEYCERNDYCIGASVGNYDYFTIPQKKSQSELKYKNVVERNFVPYEELFKKGIRVMSLSYAGDLDKEKPIIEAAFPEIELFSFAGGYGADVVQRGFSKAEGMKKLCSFYKVKLKDTYAIGDSANDVPMLKTANISIAMGNADDVAKEVANYITDRVENGGFYKAMEHFGLI